VNVSNTLLLTGLPRAGTTLSCHILNAYPNLLALHEPMTPTDFNPALGKSAAIEKIANFARESRTLALSKGIAISRQKNGAVPDNPVAALAVQGELRKLDVSLGHLDVAHQIQNEKFTLVIKHNALFTSLLPELTGSFPVYAIVRNPLAVLASWNLVDLPVNRGSLPAGEMFDPELKARLAATADRIERQLRILEWFCRTYAEHLGERVLRYEEFVVRPEVVGECLGLPAVSGLTTTTRRQSRNQSYDLELMECLYTRLRGYGDAIWSFYSRSQVDELMESIRAAG
jgi:hypothetical protein